MWSGKTQSLKEKEREDKVRFEKVYKLPDPGLATHGTWCEG
jgi:hypothetical protein